MAQFFYFLTIEGNEALLKEELKLFYPSLRFAYSRPGFCTFKNAGEDIALKTFAKKRFIFALSYGLNLKRTKIEHISAEVDELKKEGFENFNFYQLPHLQPHSGWQELKQSFQCHENSSSCVDFIQTHGDEVFIGHRQSDRFASPFLRQLTQDRADVISRAYYKGADALKLFGLKAPAEVLELGSSPGGTTQYLLENGFKVQGVDPGEMDQSLAAHADFIFHKTSVQDFRIFPKNEISILMSDINLNPMMVIGECQRLATFLPKLKYILVTCKVKNEQQVSHIRKYVKMLREMGMKRIEMVQLSYHRKEFLAFGSK